jgi:hypothetical protein
MTCLILHFSLAALSVLMLVIPILSAIGVVALLWYVFKAVTKPAGASGEATFSPIN